MMTIDQAIRHYRALASSLRPSHAELTQDENRAIATWLEELKVRREKECGIGYADMPDEFVKFMSRRKKRLAKKGLAHEKK